MFHRPESPFLRFVVSLLPLLAATDLLKAWFFMVCGNFSSVEYSSLVGPWVLRFLLSVTNCAVLTFVCPDAPLFP